MDHVSGDMADAWGRSIPAEEAGIFGVDATGSVLADIRRYDPEIRVFFDIKRRAVTVWRQPSSGPPVIQFDSPFGVAIDQRLFGYLVGADVRRQGGIDAVVAKLDEENAAVAREKFVEKWEQVDHGRLNWAVQRDRRERDGMPRGLQSAVPADLTREG